MLELRSDEFAAILDPDRGGSILDLLWHGEHVLRPTRGPGILDAACFPLVPFSNRIADGRFTAQEREIVLTPNFPDTDHPHPLHGFGWLSRWEVAECRRESATIVHDYQAAEWPWSYRAEQRFVLRSNRLGLTLSVANLGPSEMPAGLGFHPYFPRNEHTMYTGLHRGEWSNSALGIPHSLDRRDAPRDWWAGAPVSSRAVDTCYTDRAGPLEIAWPDRRLAVVMEPSPTLDRTVIYAPSDADFVCIEPASNDTDAHNRADGGLRWLRPGESLTVLLDLTVRRL